MRSYVQIFPVIFFTLILPTLFGEKPCSSPQTISDSCSRGQLYMATRAVQGVSVTTVQARTGWARVMGVQWTGQGREARPASVKSSNPTSLHDPTWKARNGLAAHHSDIPLHTSQPVSSLSPGNMVGKWSCKPLSIALCPTAVCVCRVENGNGLQGVRAAVWVGIYSGPLTEQGLDIVLFPF